MENTNIVNREINMQQGHVTTAKKSWIENLDYLLIVALILFFMWFYCDFTWPIESFPFEPLIGFIVTGGTLYNNRYAKKPIKYHFMASFQNEYAQSVTLTNRSDKPQILDIKALTPNGEVELLKWKVLKPRSIENISAELGKAVKDKIQKPHKLEVIIETKTVNDVIGVSVELIDKRTQEKTKEEVTKNSN
ncbi:hypothetical protein [Pseudoalteromonas aliena]|uniref:hypothetical protein n=1 Tax=Pseudoalteromonas aliena TaxID=247523 RepID=UPI0024957F3C|nr:hypothetical protein [Pseudoalteromonas aliena]